MNESSMYWMKYSINISKESSQPYLRVGAVLVSEHNELICSAYAGEESKESWSSVLLSKVRQEKISTAHKVYLTINTLSADNTFELMELLKEVRINKLYIGLPDPKLTCYMNADPATTHNSVYRYPDKLQREILELNDSVYSSSKQSIVYSPYYFKNRISNLVIRELKSRGFFVSKNEVNADKRKSELISLICHRYGIENSEAARVVHDAISEAFNKKYGAYSYLDDTRSLDQSWKERFMAFYKKSSAIPLSDNNILNVGVGTGNEAVALFSNCTSITFVDIAPDGLEKIKNQIPLSRVVVSSADDLSSIADNSYDLYVSLRTYNSSFFDIKKAISEARRVLKPGAVIIVSVANGFLCLERHCIISGLILPDTEFVDIYRGLDTIKLMQAEFLQAGFKDIQLLPTNTEIYLSALTAREGSDNGS